MEQGAEAQAAEQARDRRRRARRRRAAAGRALRFNLGLTGLLFGAALLWLEGGTAADLAERHGDAAGAAAETLRRADPDAISAEPIFALRGRVEDMLQRCLRKYGVGDRIRIATLPGILTVQMPGQARAAMEFDFAALKSRGPSDWTTHRPGQGVSADQARGLEALALLAVMSPGAPCPVASSPPG